MPFIDMKDTSFYYRIWEPEHARANVVFFHGLGEHSGLYHRFAHALNDQGCRVFALDHIAHGHTSGSLSAASDVSNLAVNARQLVAVAQSHSGSLPLIVIGHSLGGITASYLASTDSTQPMQGLVLTGTPLDQVAELDLDSIVMSLDPEYLDALTVDPLLPQNVVFAHFEQGMARAREVIAPQVATWTFPVLMINGELDPIAPPQSARKWIGRMKNGRSVEIKGGHHDIVNDFCYRTIARLVAAFVYENTTPDIVQS